jgi:hypothetical protein
LGNGRNRDSETLGDIPYGVKSSRVIALVLYGDTAKNFQESLGLMIRSADNGTMW